jgi:broad specificity phosphatase PhoE
VALSGGGFRGIVASPLSRARETAEIIAASLGLAAPRLYDGLVERDYGSAEGTEIVSHRALHLHAMTPDAESDESVSTRAIAALRAAVTDAGDAGDGPLIAVAHGALIRVLISFASGGEFPRPGERIENGSQHDIRLTETGIELLSFSTVPAEA